MTPEEKSRQCRAAALRRHALHDPRESTRKAREAFLDRFEREVDPDGILDPVERGKRAERAKRAYFINLSSRRGRG